MGTQVINNRVVTDAEAGQTSQVIDNRVVTRAGTATIVSEQPKKRGRKKKDAQD